MVPYIHSLKNTQVLPSHLQGVCSVTLRFVITVGKAYQKAVFHSFNIDHITNLPFNSFLCAMSTKLHKKRSKKLSRDAKGFSITVQNDSRISKN